MTNRSKPGFLSLFAGGFAAGAALMVSIHVVQPSDVSIVPPAQAQAIAR